jgi:RNA polymerase sigma factor (sigma-70 family)
MNNINLENYLNLVKSIVRKFEKKYIEDSDLYGIGCVALVEAYKSYDPQKGAFSTWATRIIKQSIFDYFRKIKFRPNLIPIEFCDNKIYYNDKNIKVDLLSFLLTNKNCSKKEIENKQILIDHFVNNKTWAEIGREKNMSRERIRQKGQQALNLIREKYRLILEDYDY